MGQCISPAGSGRVLRYVPTQLLHVRAQPTPRAHHRPETDPKQANEGLDLRFLLVHDLAQDPIDQAEVASQEVRR